MKVSGALKDSVAPGRTRTGVRPSTMAWNVPGSIRRNPALRNRPRHSGKSVDFAGISRALPAESVQRPAELVWRPEG